MVDAGVALLRAPSAALKNFRVIGVISNVLLVVDTATEGSYVIKVSLIPYQAITCLFGSLLCFCLQNTVQDYQNCSVLYCVRQFCQILSAVRCQRKLGPVHLSLCFYTSVLL